MTLIIVILLIGKLVGSKSSKNFGIGDLGKIWTLPGAVRRRIRSA